jgi:hypothetical protein
MDIGRVIVTSVIWVGCLSVALATVMTGANMIGLIFPMIMAMGGTAVLWGSDSPASRRREARRFGNQYDDYPIKAKNESTYEQKMRLLMDMMDEDERQDFKNSLKRQMLNQDRAQKNLVDGEMPFDMDDVFTSDHDEQHRR